MFSRRNLMSIIVLLLAIALVACGGAPSIEPGAPVDDGTATPEAEQVAVEALPAALAALANFLNLDEGDIELDKIEDAEWTDSCLGLGGPAESCLQAITPGYAITFIVDGESYVVRTDLQGNAVRVEAEHQTAEPGEPGGDWPAAVNAAIDRLVADMGVDLSEVEVESWSEQEWTDGCLGLGRPDESCLQAITPGYLVTLRVGDKEVNVRTDESGANVRFEESITGGEQPVAVDRAVETLARELGVDAATIELLSVTAEEWSDGCLGLGGPAESCLAAITPGYRVMLAVDGAEYEVRTDESGKAVRVAHDQETGSTEPPVEIGDALVLYERSGGFAGQFLTVRIFADGRLERSDSLNAPGDAIEIFEGDPAAVEQLLADLGDAGYFDLESSYLPQDPCCDRFLFLTAARTGADEDAHIVETVEATEDVPQAVWDSIALIEAFIEEATAE